MSYFVYILASQRNGTLYTGMTNDLKRRVWQHIDEKVEGFTKQYHIKQLVYFERFDYVQTAILREKRLKGWKRKWKLELIENFNPQWRDLSETL